MKKKYSLFVGAILLLVGCVDYGGYGYGSGYGYGGSYSGYGSGHSYGGGYRDYGGHRGYSYGGNRGYNSNYGSGYSYGGHGSSRGGEVIRVPGNHPNLKGGGLPPEIRVGRDLWILEERIPSSQPTQGVPYIDDFYGRR